MLFPKGKGREHLRPKGLWRGGNGLRAQVQTPGPSGKPYSAHLPFLLLLLLHLQLQLADHHLALPLGDGSALLVMRGDERLYV